MLVIETLACVAVTFVGQRAGALFSQSLFRFRRSFVHSFSNKTRQLIRYLPNFHGTPCLPPPFPAKFFFFHKHYPQFLFKTFAKCLGFTRCNMEDVHKEWELTLKAFAPTNLSHSSVVEDLDQ